MADQTPSLSFSPTEDLILDVLIARYRLGETTWTFDSRLAQAIYRLEEKKLVRVLNGITGNAIRASLTEHALHEHGPTWFRVSVTMDNLPLAPEHSGTAPTPDPRTITWSKEILEGLSELPQSQPDVDPRAINSAHLLLIQMLGHHHPVYRVRPGTSGSVVLVRGEESPGQLQLSTIDIAADGRSYHLARDEQEVTVDHVSTVLLFTGSESYTTESCEQGCRHRCPECRMGLGSHLSCDPLCDHHLAAPRQ
jgi:hypothetical protein